MFQPLADGTKGRIAGKRSGGKKPLSTDFGFQNDAVSQGCKKDYSHANSRAINALGSGYRRQDRAAPATDAAQEFGTPLPLPLHWMEIDVY